MAGSFECSAPEIERTYFDGGEPLASGHFDATHGAYAGRLELLEVEHVLRAGEREINPHQTNH